MGNLLIYDADGEPVPAVAPPPRALTPQARAVLRAAGRKGGLAPGKNPRPAYLARLRSLGAEFDAAGALVEGPATAQARRRLAAGARLGKAQRAARP